MEQKINLEISYQTIFKVIFSLIAVVFLFFVRDIVLALFAAFVVSTVTNPLADWAEKKNLPRVASVPLIYIGILIFLGAIFYLITPSLVREVSYLTLHFPQYIAGNVEKYPYLEQYNIPGNVDKLVSALSEFMKDQAVSLFISTVSVLSNLFYVFLAFAVSFYLTVEKNLVKKSLRKLVSRDHHDYLIQIMDQIELKMGMWFMGQIVLSIITGAAIFLCLTILGVPFALSLAVLAAILRFIPFLGGLISDSFGVLIALLNSPLLGIAAFLMYYLIQQTESYILIPYVMRKTVGLNPIIVMTAVIAGGQLGGIIGALLAIPITLILVILFKEFVLKEKTV